MIKTFVINKGQKPTEKQWQGVIEAKKYPIEFDEDCPELSLAMYKAFRSVVIQRNRKNFLDEQEARKLLEVYHYEWNET